MDNYFYMTVQKDSVVVKYTRFPSKKKVTKKFKDYEDYLKFFNDILVKRGIKATDLTIMCSSSMDFPNEYTKKKSVIALANKLRQY